MSRRFEYDPDDDRRTVERAAERQQRQADARRARAAPGATAPSRRRAPLPPAPAGPPARFYRPPGFDPLSLGFTPDEAFGVYYFLHVIRWKRLQWQADEWDFTRLKFDYLERVIGRPLLTKVRARLLQKGVIEWDRRGGAGGTCDGYRVRPEHRAAPWQLITCADERLNRRIRRAHADGAVKPLPVHDWLTARFDALTFDLGRARQLIAALPVPAEFPAAGRTADEYCELLEDQCRALADRMWETAVCRYGRFHTPVTRLHRALRPCLSAGGRPLVELDVANSQPLFLGLAAREYHRSPTAKKRLLARDFVAPGGVYRHGSRPGRGAGPCANAGVEAYVRLCERGQFYESLLDPGGDRDRLKEELFRDVLFGRNPGQAPRPMQRKFADRHPAVAEALSALKLTDYRRSAWVLQNAEAALIIGGVCGRLMRERPDLAVFTVHDSFLVPAADAEYVRRVAADEFRRRGVAALVRVKG